jgi:hypothetical protein
VLPDPYHWIENPWVLGVGTVALLGELLLDKIPMIDPVNDVIGTVIRPATGGLIFAASQAADHVDGASLLRDHQWVAVVLGVSVAAAVHLVKAVSRPAINLTTAGVGGPIVSTAEDASAFALCAIAIFAPVLVIGALILLGWGLHAMWVRAGRSRARVRALGAIRLWPGL